MDEKTDRRFIRQRDRMVKNQIMRRGIRNPLVIEAMRAVPRHEFIPREMRHMAYHDGALPIGFGQTISQPYIVALMTELITPHPDDTVLDVGTGTGYQAAVLAEVVHHVTGIERIPEIANLTRKRLTHLGYENIDLHVGDGSLGWQENAPYDAIMVAAAAPIIPPALVDQLAPGGRMILPVGPGIDQMIVCVYREMDGRVRVEENTPVRFVPLIGEQGFFNDNA